MKKLRRETFSRRSAKRGERQHGNGRITAGAGARKRACSAVCRPQADAKRRIAVEQRAAAREIEDSRRNADVEARQLMAEAEQRAGEETEKILARARTECEKMQSAARANLERAAQWIAEEVVNDKWQS